MCEYICTPLYVNVYEYVFICMHVHLAIYIYIYIYIVVRVYIVVRTCVCAYTYTHIQSTAFRTQAFQHTDTHTNTHTCKHRHACMNACAHVDTRFADHMQQLVQHVRYIDWHILRPAVLRHIMHTRIRISYMELHPSMRVLYMTLHLHAQIHTREYVNTSVHVYM